ncbi:DgyrCDS12844 [Dimorphilus gyrociliatus]|nr:DgyrCDS12844 [Dimorphilus gyrociliatus]
MPDDATYRTSTEEIVKERLGVVNSNKNVSDIEKKINCGQAEELILQAERELDLARKFLEWRPWEPMKEKAPEGQWKWPHP